MLFLAFACAPRVAGGGESTPTAAATPAATHAWKKAGDKDPCTVVKVIDGDTVDVKLPDGKVERLRLLSVDTEESYNSPSKPSTPFGKRTSAWAKSYIHKGEPCEVEYGPEYRDVYKRLLAYFWYEGENYNLKIVRDGRSPYFTKYGYSVLHHEEFVAAEAAAKAEKLGLWNPKERGDLRGDYAELEAWWNGRADALRDFEKQAAQRRDIYAVRSDYSRLMKHMGETVTVFTAIRHGDISGMVYLGQAEGRTYEPLEIVAMLSKREAVDALKASKGRFRYFTGRLTKGADGKVRLLIEDAKNVAEAPPPAS